MRTTDQLMQIWGVRTTYPVTVAEFLALLKEESEKAWIVENQDNGDGTVTNEIHLNEHRYVLVSRRKMTAT